MNQLLTIWAARDPWERDVQFVILQKPPSVNGEALGRRAIVKSLTLEGIQDGESIKPSFSLSDSAAQDLFNELWRIGFRPADGTGNSGHIEALKYHLEDMRKLVFPDSKPVRSL